MTAAINQNLYSFINLLDSLVSPLGSIEAKQKEQESREQEKACRRS